MAQKGNKYALLDKEQNDQADMIEMVDMSGFKGNGNHDESSKDDIDYVRLDDQEIKVQKPKSQPQQVQQSQKKPVPKSPRSKPQPQTQAPIYPTHSANPNPTRINMNGMNFKMQNAPEPKKASKFPEMKVACNFCTFEQMVPGNTQVYVCCCCNNMNQCFPLYGIFICGSCQCKVCYPYGTSEMIRCTRCGTVNRVPSEPQRSYIKELPKSQVSKEPIKQQKKKQQFKFENEDEIIIEHQEEPQKPVKKIQEEELLFDDVPLQKSSKEQTYPDIL